MNTDLNIPLAATCAMALRRFPDAELHALNLGIEFGSRLGSMNISFRLALDSGLIDKTGYFLGIEELKAALTVVVNERILA